MNNRLINTKVAGGGGCTNTVDLYNPFPDGGGVALYQLNGDATDVSGNYDGTATNVTYGTGQFGQAGVFNGSNSQILVSSVSGFPSGNSARTLSFWMNSSSYLNGGVLGYGAAANNEGFLFYIENSNLTVTFYLNDASVNYSLSTNQWYNIVATHDGSTFTVYVNGSSVYSAAKTLNTSATNFKIGGAPWNSSGEYFGGSIDQVRIFSRALRPYEVEALYTEEYCTPTIVPSEHFNTVLYNGNGSTQSITSVGFAPDLTWIKERTGTDHHRLQDTVRGAGYRLYSSTTSAEGYTNDSITSFNADGFSLGGSWGVNESSQDYVSWNFKAGGAAVTNTDGTITSQVSANTEAGFSIVTFTGNGTTASVGHGLDKKPSIIITKSRNAVDGWFVQQYMYAPSGNAAFGFLNTTAAFTGFTDSITNDSVMQQGGSNGVNYVSYCFAEVEGFSSIGSYVGTGASGNTVVTGFEPAFVMIKRTDSTGSWYMIDNKRSPENVRDRVLFANLSNAEQQGQGAYYYPMNFLENGFELTQAVSDGYNANGGKYIYMAFAADPTTVEPSLEDSFNTVLYTGNRGTKEVTGIGFQPDFIWLKNRDAIASNFLHDTVRGKNNNYYYSLITNGTFAESTTNQAWHDSYGWISDIYDGGFTVNQGSVIDDVSYNNTQDYVAWCWKGAEIPAINSNGSIPSVVSANPAAGFSIVSCTATVNADTIGHGLGVAPSVIIYKTRSATGNWSVYHQSLGNTKGLYLNLTDAALTSQFFWNNTSPASDVFTAYGNPGNTQIAYCFAEVAGFSKFGSYTGTGSAGNAQVLGFEPAFVMAKRTDNASGWVIIDTVRGNGHELYPHSSIAELSSAEGGTYDRLHLTATGFEFTSSAFNESGSTWIYMAFANQF